MADKPILFSAPMVLAILREIKEPGTGKTQTRRIAKSTPDSGPQQYSVGDRLWVRERFAVSGIGWGKKPSEAVGGRVHYHADPNHGWHSYWGNWHPSIHMPRWASRITLEVTNVRCQQLQEISEADAIAEGCRPYFDEDNAEVIKGPNGTEHSMAPLRGPIDDFQRLWDSLNGTPRKPGGPDISWQANPHVVAVTFRPRLCNIDQLEAAA